ncbi:MAG: epoxyqueuosine reductase QueH [Synergistaceae bacterium]|jgi:predicted adenine nucleotide alpha hydrolase (AANH) superfamily ATPase|nr:epoxyqueuosine reductase QueH [Synergistaceae bacterium]
MSLPELREIPAARRCLLHVCCAPDAVVPFRDMKAEGWEIIGYFYGSNIHPEDEFCRRAAALGFLARSEGIEVFARPYNPEEWFARASVLAAEPERGARCTLCFEMQLRAAAEEGRRRGATHLGTTLSISPRKDAALISRLGREIGAAYGLTWDDRVWRKNDGFLRSLRIGRELGLYRQNYCGCLYSKPEQKTGPVSRNQKIKGECLSCPNIIPSGNCLPTFSKAKF